MDSPPAPPVWAAERELGAAEAAQVVAAQFPALRGLPVEPLAIGWDNTVHLVGGRWVFRFPRRAVALPGFARELAVLPRLSARLPLPVPAPVWRGVPTEAFPWPFAGAALLPGRELADTGLPDARRAGVAAALGAFLRALHDPRLAEEVGADLPVDPNVRADAGVRARLGREWLGRLAARGLWSAASPEAAAVEALYADAEGLGAPPAPPVVVHADLHVRHVLVDDAGAAAGVLDWGDVCRADPAVDLALAYSAFAGPARTALLASYGGIGRDREVRARVLAVFLSAALAEYAAAEGSGALLREALAGLRRAVT